MTPRRAPSRTPAHLAFGGTPQTLTVRVWRVYGLVLERKLRLSYPGGVPGVPDAGSDDAHGRSRVGWSLFEVLLWVEARKAERDVE